MKNWKILALVSLSEILGIYDKILIKQKTPGGYLRTLAIIIYTHEDLQTRAINLRNS